MYLQSNDAGFELLFSTETAEYVSQVRVRRLEGAPLFLRPSVPPPPPPLTPPC
jgi:hypothetical protein